MALQLIPREGLVVLQKLLFGYGVGWFSGPILLGTVVVATSLYSPRALLFSGSLVANKTLKLFFGSANEAKSGALCL